MSHIRNTGFKGLNSYIDGDPDPDTNQVWPTCMSKNQEKCFLSAYHLSFSWTDRCHYFFLDFGQFNSFALELIPIRTGRIRISMPCMSILHERRLRQTATGTVQQYLLTQEFRKCECSLTMRTSGGKGRH